MTRRILGILAVILLFAAVAPGGPAVADEPADYGYWSKAQTPDSPSPSIPSPPTVPVAPPDQVVPANGMYVALAATTSQPDPTQVPSPAEPAAVSALRFFVEPGSPAILSLTVAEGQDANGREEQNHPAFVVDACAVDFAAPAWDAPEGAGRWEDRPVWDCEATSTPSIVEEDGTRLTWDLGSAFEVFEGQIDVVLVPRGVEDPTSPNGVQPVPFQLGFEPPDDQTLTVEVLDTGGEEELGGEEFTLDSLDLEGLGDFALGDDTFGLIDDPTAAVEDGGSEPRRGTRPIRPIGRAPIPLDSRGDRILAVSLLFLLGAGLWWVGGSPVRAPRLLGSLAGPAAAAPSRVTTGGVGRFTRPRTGRPPRL